MSFTSLWYFPFLFLVAGIYYYLNSRIGSYDFWKPCFLLAVSWFVYALFGLWHFLLLFSVTVVSYGFGIVVNDGKKGRKLLLAAGTVMIAGILVYVKYSGMFLSWIGTAAGIFGRELSFPERYVILPVGISFYTFQAISYMVDVYRGGPKAQNFIRYALYISFFPQLVAGPIEQASWLLPQLNGQRASAEDISIGCRYLLSGCVRKFVIADYMAGFVDEAYGSVMQQSGGSLFVATVCFAVQIYCDFSGYTHIAIGSARFLGIRLTENFDRPYLARGCRDFWKRWHITLTKWFTEYVYIPLGGSRKGRRKTYVNIMIVFLLSGLWHGANLKFLLWGAFFGIWRIVEDMACKRSTSKRIDSKKIAPNKTAPKKGCLAEEKALQIWLQRFATFLLVCISWVLFRSQSVAEAAEVLRRIFTLETGHADILSGMELFGAAARIGILALLPAVLKSKGAGEKETGEKGRSKKGTSKKEAREQEAVNSYYVVTVLVFLIGVCMLSLFNSGSASSFIYFQF